MSAKRNEGSCEVTNSVARRTNITADGLLEIYIWQGNGSEAKCQECRLKINRLPSPQGISRANIFSIILSSKDSFF